MQQTASTVRRFGLVWVLRNVCLGLSAIALSSFQNLPKLYLKISGLLTTAKALA